ncbi:MAG: hypothetical protein EAZ62_07750, partial [Sphingobacteriia bacterium]
MTDTTCSPAPLGAQRTTPPVAPQAPTTLYLLALQPPAAFLRPPSVGTGPHLPLADFWEVARFSAPPSMEATVERWLQKL